MFRSLAVECDALGVSGMDSHLSETKLTSIRKGWQVLITCWERSLCKVGGSNSWIMETLDVCLRKWPGKGRGGEACTSISGAHTLFGAGRPKYAFPAAVANSSEQL